MLRDPRFAGLGERQSSPQLGGAQSGVAPSLWGVRGALSTQGGSQDPSPPKLGVLGGNREPVTRGKVGGRLGELYFQPPDAKGGRVGVQVLVEPPKPVGGMRWVPQYNHKLGGFAPLCPLPTRNPHSTLRVGWGVMGEGWVLSLHPRVPRGPDTPSSGCSQHWGAAGEDGMGVVTPPSHRSHAE